MLVYNLEEKILTFLFIASEGLLAILGVPWPRDAALQSLPLSLNVILLSYICASVFLLLEGHQQYWIKGPLYFSMT